jgi:pimeloyl-ACP methyl ester carboxylesterase
LLRLPRSFSFYNCRHEEIAVVKNRGVGRCAIALSALLCAASLALIADAVPAVAKSATPSIVSAPVRVARTADGLVGYREIGHGTPLLMVTGLGASMEQWDPALVNDLALHYRVVIFDNAGIGETQALPSPLTITAMAGQTSALISALHLGRPDVLGWSMGGMVAQALAVLHPHQVRRLVLCATQAGNGKAVPPPADAAAAVAGGNAAAVLATIFPADQQKAEKAYVTGILGYGSLDLPTAAVRTSQNAAIDAWFAGDQAAGTKVAGLSVPALVADGTVDTLDPVVNDHQLAKLFGHSQLELYPGAGHAFLFQDATSFAARVHAFLG